MTDHHVQLVLLGALLITAVLAIVIILKGHQPHGPPDLPPPCPPRPGSRTWPRTKLSPELSKDLSPLPLRERTTVVTGPCEPRQIIMVGEPVEEVELHINAPALHIVVMVGNQAVVIDKLYGPAMFRPVRITPSTATGEWYWLVEQEVSDHPRGLEDHWQEVARFDAIHDDDKSEVPDD